MKFLTLVNAHALAHVSRTLGVANALRRRGWETVFAGFGDYLAIAGREGFETVELPFMPLAQAVDAIRTSRIDRIYLEDQMRGYVAAELDLFARVRPSFLLIDNRMTALTSADLAGIPAVSVLNVHLSSHRRIPFYSVGNTVLGKLGGVVRAFDAVENAIEGFLLDRFVLGQLGRLRESLGLKKRYGYGNEEASLILYPDVPEMSPVKALPAHAHYIGPLTWKNDLPAPSAIERSQGAKRRVYFSLGSASLENVVGEIAGACDPDTAFIVATGAVELDANQILPPNVFVERYVNADLLLPHCDLVVCHGGNGTIYQALSHGVPIVAVATHAEQHYGVKRVVALGLGRGFHLSELRRGLAPVAAAIRRVLDEDRYRARAREFQKIIARYGDSAETAAALIERWWTSGRSHDTPTQRSFSSGGVS